MIRRNTWIFLAILAGLLVVAWFSQRNKANVAANATPTAALPALFQVEEPNIKAIKIANDQGQSVRIGRDSSGVWVLQDPQTDSTDVAQIEAAVGQLLGLKALSVVDPPPPAEATGLNPGQNTIELTLNDGSQQTAYIGKQTPTGSGYYLQVNQGAVYVVSQTGVDSVMKLAGQPPILPTPTPEVSATPATETTPAAAQTEVPATTAPTSQPAQDGSATPTP